MFNFNTKNLLFIVIFLFATPQVNAFWGTLSKTISAISKSTKVLPGHEVIKLSKLSTEIKGTVKVGKELERLKLSNEALEDAFLRIAIHQKKLTRKEAEEMFLNLRGVTGFRQTLRKIVGNSETKTAGHLNELRIAQKSNKNGFKILGIGEKFNDGLKRSSTDIDLILDKNGKKFIIEVKYYATTSKISMDNYRADLDTLIKYKNKNGNNIIPIFTITNKPKDSNYLKMLQYEADKRGVQLIFGNPQEQIEQIKILGKIL
ncbi:PDDEXK family nuclease [Candidatus Venteria ishoeyi]|uniref:Uncharacterized protein n=1 Tax=Candidatus Venteria ishoeyi TaxID=1899563 RepID=A0A1H6F6K3_9GAMM|nr:hypothetical protein [Candidatus Venteria ishoeyi]SEH04929.1 Uncharacterised protein [Candidatus Venteria ishoeyi]